MGEAPTLRNGSDTRQSQRNPDRACHPDLLGDAFELTDLGSLVVKDFQAARAWRVEAERQAAGRFDAVMRRPFECVRGTGRRSGPAARLGVGAAGTGERSWLAVKPAWQVPADRSAARADR